MSDDTTSDNELDFENHDDELPALSSVDSMYSQYFLEYASYVILERAVPHVTALLASCRVRGGAELQVRPRQCLQDPREVPRHGGRRHRRAG